MHAVRYDPVLLWRGNAPNSERERPTDKDRGMAERSRRSRRSQARRRATVRGGACVPPTSG